MSIENECLSDKTNYECDQRKRANGKKMAKLLEHDRLANEEHLRKVAGASDQIRLLQMLQLGILGVSALVLSSMGLFFYRLLSKKEEEASKQ